MSIAITQREAASADATTSKDVPPLRVFVFALFFLFGGITSLNDVLIPKLKDLFTLRYGEVMLVQSAFFAAYFFISSVVRSPSAHSSSTTSHNPR